MPAIGITGGVSTGKSTFCEYLRQILPDARFFDADQSAREVVELPEVKEELINEFGGEIFAGHDLNRAALRAIVFADADKKKALEKILHPRIRQRWSAEAETHRQSPEFFFADIPLLYETDGQNLCDRVVVVACSPEIQLANFVRRSKLDQQAAKQVIESQMPLGEKIRRADHVVWNNAGREVLGGQAKLLVDSWRQEKWTKK